MTSAPTPGEGPPLLPVGRRDDEIAYTIERDPPYRVVAAKPIKARDLPITPVLLGMPAAFIVKILEPELPTFLEQLTRALGEVRPGEPIVLTYRSARYQSRVRVAEIVDRGPAYPHIYVFCRAQDPYR